MFDHAASPAAPEKEKKSFFGWFKKHKPSLSNNSVSVAPAASVVAPTSAATEETNSLQEQKKFYQKLFTRPSVTPSAPQPAVVKPSVNSAPVSSLPIATPSPTTPSPSAATPTPSLVSLVTDHIESMPDMMKRATTDFPSQQPVIPRPLKPTAVKKEAAPHISLFKRLFSKNVTYKLVAERERELAWQERNQVEKRSWQPANAIKPNLIKNQEVLFFNWHENLLVLALSLVMCCLAIGLLYVGLLIWQKERLDTSRVALLNAQVIDEQIALGEQEAKEIKTFTYKLNIVGSLLNNHIYWTNFLAFLENNTLKDVYYDKFSGDISGNYSIPSVAKNLEAISLQLEVMKAYPKVKSLTPDTGQTSADGSSVNFNLGMSVDPTLFTK